MNLFNECINASAFLLVYYAALSTHIALAWVIAELQPAILLLASITIGKKFKHFQIQDLEIPELVFKFVLIRVIAIAMSELV